jgi:hypothetical protein
VVKKNGNREEENVMPGTQTKASSLFMRREGWLSHTALFFAPHKRRDTPAVAREESARNC